MGNVMPNMGNATPNMGLVDFFVSFLELLLASGRPARLLACFTFSPSHCKDRLRATLGMKRIGTPMKKPRTPDA
jgi:hypothetical protein